MELDEAISRPHESPCMEQFNQLKREAIDRHKARNNIVCWEPWDLGAVLAVLPYLAVLLLVLGVAVFR